MLKLKIKPSEFMVYPTLQKYWIEEKGILLWLGLFFVEFGASLFLVASIFDCFWGQVLGWLAAGVLGGGAHFLFLGNPQRIYKAVRRARSSWISRGLIIISAFQLFGFIQLVSAFLDMPSTGVIIVANILAVASIAYGGYEIADVKSIRTWNTSFLPVQMFARSFFCAMCVMLAIYLLMGVETIAYELNVKKWMFITIIVNLGLFLIYISSLGIDEGRQHLSLNMIIKGDLKSLFWGVIGIGGILLPILLILYGAAIGVSGIGTGLYFIVALLQVIADPILRYCSLRSGYYETIFPVKPVEFKQAN